MKMGERKVFYTAPLVVDGGENTFVRFHTDGTYICDHWGERDLGRWWKIEDGKLMWTSQDNNNWLEWESGDPKELARQVEAAILMENILST
jgi:hypothetical protein